MNTSSSATASDNAGVNTGVIGALQRLIGWLDSVPYSLLALPLRFAVATVFWNSGTTIRNRRACYRASAIFDFFINIAVHFFP